MREPIFPDAVVPSETPKPREVFQSLLEQAVAGAVVWVVAGSVFVRRTLARS